MQRPPTPFVYRSGGALDFSRRRRDCGARPLREENRDAVLRKRPRPHPLRRGRFRLPPTAHPRRNRSEEHTSELQSQSNLVCRLLLEKKKKKKINSQSRLN